MTKKVEKRAKFRFYEELNDFLPGDMKKRDVDYCFNGNPSVKDSIEAHNVPHTEVDFILVNGRPAGFSQKLEDGDRVSVYPVFESFDIGAERKLPGKPARYSSFIADVHLGKLARLLRMTGFDTLYRNDLEDNEIIDVSIEQERIILTRDRGILKNSRVTRGYFIRSQNPREQLREVITRFQLYSSIRFLCRCISCNGNIDRVDKEDIEHRLKPGTASYFDSFFRCTGCGKIYWKGSHYDRMRLYYNNLLSELGA